MCGIVGAASSTFLTTLDQKTFVQLLTVDVLRGAHSTGVMWADSYASKGEFIKAVGDPYTFFRAEGVKETLDGLKKPSFLVGHNRYATQGKINVENAHPFNHKHITMVHNGTLRAWDSKNFDVDSKWACHMLAEEGVQALVDKATTKCAYAYVWHNENDHTLNFLRNHERPLYYYLEHGDLFFASEELMLEWVLTRNSHWQPLVIKEFRAHHHYCFNLKDLTYSVKEVRPTQTNYFPSYTDNAKVNRETVHGLFYKFETHNYSANDTRSGL
jgi:glucosamine 6-phosphate synthetase-like amidotransferase/phosphosugar isomerase protein